MKYYDMGFRIGLTHAKALNNLEKEVGNNMSFKAAFFSGVKAAFPVVKETFILSVNPLNHIRIVGEMLVNGVRKTLMSGMEGSVDGMLQGMFNNRPQ